MKNTRKHAGKQSRKSKKSGSQTAAKNRQQSHAKLQALIDQGVYKPKRKIDKRKNITKAQQQIIKQNEGFFSGVVRFLKGVFNPNTYKKIFKVKHGVVQVPKEKGTTTRVVKGKIVQTRRGPRGEKVKRTVVPMAPTQLPQQPAKPVTYVIPFKRGPGKYVFIRFPSYQELADYMAQYAAEHRYEDWADYVFEEEISGFSRDERDAAMLEAMHTHGKIKGIEGVRLGRLKQTKRRHARRHRRKKR